MSKTAPLLDLEPRRRAIESAGSVLVQAPAGSGKTTLLTQRYLRLLGRVADPAHILALTFTRRAAREMRERVLEALSAARAGACLPSLNAESFELARAALHHLDSAGIQIERHPSRLRIETIDAFNAWLVRQLPITATASLNVAVLSDATHCYEEAARRALSHESGDRFGEAVERVLELDDQRWRKLIKVIAGMLASRERWLPLLAGRLHLASALEAAQLELIRRQLDEDLQLLLARLLLAAHAAIGAERLAALAELMHAAVRRRSAVDARFAPWLADATPLRADLADLARWRALAAQLLTKQGGFRKALTAEQGFAAGSAQKRRMLELLEELERDAKILELLQQVRIAPEPRYSDEQWGRVREVAQVLVLAAAELEQVFKAQGMVDFAAISMAAVRALGSADAPSDLALRLDYHLQHVLVDEFQDTSSAQLDLLRQLTAGWQREDGRSLFCVGDPMQAIYGFRQAEVRAFLDLAESGVGALDMQVERLSTNFRSAAALVAWINATFARILPRTDDRQRGAIAFRPGVAGPSAPEGAGAVTLHAFAGRRAEAQGIAELIAGQHAARADWRIAVLVRARAHAREIAAALRAQGVAFCARDIEPLEEQAVVRDVISLISALCHLADRTAWLALLRAPWAGLTLSDLLTLSRGRPLIWEAMMDEGLLATLSADGAERCRRVRTVLENAFRVRTHTSLARWVERTWLALGGASLAGSPEQLHLAAAAFERLADLERGGLPDASQLREAFSELFAETGGSAAVEIMTIHKAKGLEFDVVVVPALERSVATGRDRMLETHQFARTARDGLAMAARPGIGAPEDPLFEFLRYQIRDAGELEAERLLYVACTRAKSQLHLTATIDPAADRQRERPAAVPGGGWRPRAGSLLAVLWPVLGVQFERQRLALDAAQEPSTEAAQIRGGPLCRAPHSWQPPLLDAPTHAAQVLSAQVGHADTPLFDWVSETARRVGILVHAQLRALDAAAVDAAALRGRLPHFRRWLASHGVPHEHLDESAARVLESLIAMQEDERGRWILRRYGDEAREQAWSQASADAHDVANRALGADSASARGIVRVIFDRSFIDEQGIRWVIDYKTSRHSGGGVEEFLDREVERYRPQLNRYARVARRLGPQPVRVGLYFPLLRAWREWAPED